MYYSIFKDNLFICKLFLIKLRCLVILSFFLCSVPVLVSVGKVLISIFISEFL